MKYFIVGAGIWGSVMAERIAQKLGLSVIIIDKRNHTGGNCYSFIDSETGIECHKYGSHIFHTSIPAVFDYISQLCELNSYRHTVLTKHNNSAYVMPVNLSTINSFYKKNFSPVEAADFLAEEIARENIDHPENLEEKAITLIGRPLYEAFIKNYTHKQWGREPRELPASIINRLPFRTSYLADYFFDERQGIPKEGYHRFFNKLLSHPNITVRLNCDYAQIRHELPSDAKVIYSGMPDALFDYKYGHLEWRSLRFEWETHTIQDFQGTAVMNYADLDVPWTRIHEFKHYHPERASTFKMKKTVISKEYPLTWTPEQEAYYPINDSRNSELYARYLEEANRTPGLILGGRLGSYRYWDMDKAIEDALNCFTMRICPQQITI